jgi:hypothetical protein
MDYTTRQSKFQPLILERIPKAIMANTSGFDPASL